MKRNAIIFLGTIFSVGTLLILGLFLNEHIKRINNRRNLEEIIATKLPQLPEFEMIDFMSEDFESPVGSCFYSRNYYSMGSSLNEETAVTTYIQSLEDLGWGNFQYSTLSYGRDADVSVSGWRSSNVFLNPLVPEEIISEYKSIIVVSVTHISC